MLPPVVAPDNGPSNVVADGAPPHSLKGASVVDTSSMVSHANNFRQPAKAPTEVSDWNFEALKIFRENISEFHLVIENIRN